MPVQINEMVLRANIVEPGAGNSKPAAAGKATDAGALNKDEIIKECTEIILEILRNKNER